MKIEREQDLAEDVRVVERLARSEPGRRMGPRRPVSASGVEPQEPVRLVLQGLRVCGEGGELGPGREGRVGIDLEPHRIVAGEDGLQEGGADPGERVQDTALRGKEPVHRLGDEILGESGDPRNPTVYGLGLVRRERRIEEPGLRSGREAGVAEQRALVRLRRRRAPWGLRTARWRRR